MKLNRKSLRKMILKEIKILTESQVYPGSGLPHGFNNYDLAKKIFNALAENETTNNLMALRKTALKREKKILHSMSQSSSGTYEYENKVQEITLLNQAIDAIDHHLGSYQRSHVVGSAGGIPWDDDLGQYGTSPKGQPLKRRYKRVQRDLLDHGMGSSIGPYDPERTRYK